MTMAKYALQRGLSLVEVMIGITIALILTLGLMVVIMGTSRGFQTQDDFARLQENGMTALSYIGDSIRHAGFYGIGTAGISRGREGDRDGGGGGPSSNAPRAERFFPRPFQEVEGGADGGGGRPRVDQ